MEVADRIVAELEIEHFFNIQLVGDHVIEINPRISTIVYQEDLNLPYLGVKRALGEISATSELVALRAADPARAHGAALLRPARVGRMSATGPRGRVRPDGRPLRVVHCPVNTAGVPWTNVQALRRRGVDARLVVFKRYALHPEADWSLERHGGFAAPAGDAVARARAAAAAHRRLPLLLRPHARPAVAAVPDPARARARSRSCTTSARTSAARRRSELAYGKKAGARDRRQLRRDPLGARGRGDPAGHRPRAIAPAPPSDRARPVDPPRAVVAPAQGHRARDRRRARGSTPTSSIVEGLHHDEAFERYRDADIVVDQLNAGWYGLFAIECMALGKPVVTFLHDEAVARTEEAFGTRVPIVSRDRRRRSASGSRRSSPTRAERRRASGARVARRTSSASTTSSGSTDRLLDALRSTLDGARSGASCKRLGKHSAIYGLGGLVSRILAVLLLPLYTHYLSPSDYGQIETLVALTTVLAIVLRSRDLDARSSASTSTPTTTPARRARAAHVVLVHDGDGDARARRRAPRFAAPISERALRRRRRREPRPRARSSRSGRR